MYYVGRVETQALNLSRVYDVYCINIVYKYIVYDV